MESENSLKLLITGGSGTLGRAVCRAFLDAGAAIASIERGPRKPDLGAGASSAARFHLVVGDPSNAASADAAVGEAARTLGGLDAVCHLAGAFEMAPLESSPPDQIERMLTANFRTAYHTTRASIPHLRRTGHGKIVFTGARPALTGGPNMSAYAASKAAVLSLARSLAAELLGDNIQVNVILPSTFDTPANRAAMPDADPTLWPKAEQIAAVVRWLCSTESDIVSGAEIPVYGRA